MVRELRALHGEEAFEGESADAGGVVQQWTRVRIQLHHGGDTTAALHWVPTPRGTFVLPAPADPPCGPSV